MTLDEFKKTEPAIAEALEKFCRGEIDVIDVSVGYEDGEKVWYATLQKPGYNSTWIVYQGGIWSF